ncbi:MAG: hypothetical protein IPP96_17705 [Chitinophagaceae bacterium]|nr:hypothetical protein [Chitinophagaceae bacterium]
MEDSQYDHLTEMDLQLEGEVRHQFANAAIWSKFISIVVFSACGLMLVLGIMGGMRFFNSMKRLGGIGYLFGNFTGTILLLVILFVAAAISLVYYFLFNFSRKIKSALISEDINELNAGLRSLKIFFIITTVFSILSLFNTIAKLVW